MLIKSRTVCSFAVSTELTIGHKNDVAREMAIGSEDLRKEDVIIVEGANVCTNKTFSFRIQTAVK